MKITIGELGGVSESQTVVDLLGKKTEAKKEKLWEEQKVENCLHVFGGWESVGVSDGEKRREGLENRK